MSELGDIENVAESALGGGGSLQQDAENLAVQEGEKELQNVGGQEVTSDVENALGGTQGIKQDLNKDL
jgi:hypothetical protein